MIFPAGFTSYQCLKVQFHKLAQDAGGKGESQKEVENHCRYAPVSSKLGGFAFHLLLFQLRQETRELVIHLLLGVTPVTTSVCRLLWVFYVPTGCYLVSLLLKCLRMLFHYVESGRRQTDACEAAVKLAPGLQCLW